MKKIAAKKRPVTPSQVPSKPITVLQYEKKLPANYATICKKLRSLIKSSVPKATSKVWHGHPVWFLGDSPIVGYNITAKKGISLLFWNGQAFKNSALTPVGKFKAAQILFQDINEIDVHLIQKLLKKSGKEIWDYRDIKRG